MPLYFDVEEVNNMGSIADLLKNGELGFRKPCSGEQATSPLANELMK